MDDLQYRIGSCVAIRTILVLNLVIYGWPSIQNNGSDEGLLELRVLNLVIYGWPSIRYWWKLCNYCITVLNLVIYGWPSILEVAIRSPCTNPWF